MQTSVWIITSYCLCVLEFRKCHVTFTHTQTLWVWSVISVRMTARGVCAPQMCFCVCVWNSIHVLNVLHRKWQQSTSCSAGNLICRAGCPGCYHTYALEPKYMEEQNTHARTHSTNQHPVYFSLSCIVTWAYSKYKLFVLGPALLRGLFLCVCASLCSSYKPTPLLINVICSPGRNKCVVGVVCFTNKFHLFIVELSQDFTNVGANACWSTVG